MGQWDHQAAEEEVEVEVEEAVAVEVAAVEPAQ
jgi:hypothetical protein